MLENRSFNNIFGTFPGVRGTDHRRELRPGGAADAVSGLAPGRSAARPGRVPQLLRTAASSTGSAPGSTATSGPTPRCTSAQVPNYWEWAREYALSDNFFASVAGPSYPNHFFFIAGTSGGVIDNPENIETRVDGDKTYKSWGCDAIGDDVFVFTKDDQGNLDEARHVLHVPHRGPAAHARRASTGPSTPPCPGRSGYFWNAYNGVSRGLPYRPVARAHAAGRQHRERHQGEQASGRHVGHAPVRALGSPAHQHRASPTTGSRTSWTRS